MNREWNRLRWSIIGFVVFPGVAMFFAWLVS